jgi:gliding motility-associated-like protein
MDFVQNKGQWDSQVEYRGDFTSGSFFLEKQGFTVLLHNTDDLRKVADKLHGSNYLTTPGEPVTLHSFAYKVQFLGGNSFARQEGVVGTPEKIQEYHNNYFIGSDPNIDVRYYSDGEKMKYDIVVHPGGNVNLIAMKYAGIQKLELKNEELIINTPVGSIKELYPYTYQVQTGKKQNINCKYVVKGDVVSFKIKDYDVNETLVIDPSLIFSTYTGSYAENWGYTATPDPDGNFYAGGTSYGTGYPVSPGAFQTTFGGGFDEDGYGPNDIAIIKLSKNGSRRLYATYIGGNGNEQPHSMICDQQGNLYITGRTASNNFPGALRPGNRADHDIFVIKLKKDGSGPLLGSIRIGGRANDAVNIRQKYVKSFGDYATRRNYGDDARGEIILDAAGNVLVASCTQSNDFPTTTGVFQKDFGGGNPGVPDEESHFPQDGVILKFNSNLTSVLFSTYFGGSGDDACFVLSQSPVTGDIYVAGGTNSSNLPGKNAAGVMQPNYAGGVVDGFVTQIKSDGSAVVRTTYQGTPGNDMVYGLQFDKKGFPYIMGTTTGAWTKLNALYFNPAGKQFISKLKPDLSGYVYSTYFGSGEADPNLSPIAFLVDRCENVYVSGWGGGINNNMGYPSAGTLNLPEKNSIANNPPDDKDFYFFVLKKNADSLLFASHFGQFGGTLGEHVDGGTSRFDGNGIVYQALCACKDGGTNFPIQTGVYAPRNNGPLCNEAAVKIEMNFAGVSANIKTIANNIPNAVSGCNPFTIKVFDSTSRAKTFYWNWGDGSKIDTLHTSSDTSHTFNLPAGVDEAYFTITLIAEDSNTCNIRDTSFKRIKVSTNFATLGLSFVKLDPCTNLSYQFTNRSVAYIGSFDSKGFIWNFGDGATDTGSINYNPVHRYASPGSYRVTLCVVDSFVCNAPDCIDTLLSVAANVRAGFTPVARGCINTPVTFTNTSTGGQTFLWEFGDGQTSTDNSLTVTHTYTSAQTFRVRLIAYNPNTCNKSDTTAYFPIVIFDKPKARFDWSPNPPIINKPTRFNNQSIGATRYLWDFGDGETSTEVNPVHQYNETKTFTAILYAYNIANCVDSAVGLVPILINPLLDIPTAFTPGRFGINGIVKVEGFGIGKMDWKIYNRWGQVVFATSNRRQGWDGKFKGQLQPMDVYAYTLDVEFTDGKKLRKTGDITLLR